MEQKYKMMTEQLRMTHSDEEVANYLRWVITSDIAKDYYKNKVDIKYLGIPNICFSLTEKDDEREVVLSKQRIERGFDDSETWSLKNTITRFIIPRLERYEEIANDFLKRDDELINDVNSFLTAMKLIEREYEITFTNEEKKQVQDGLNAFPKIFFSLWW